MPVTPIDGGSASPDIPSDFEPVVWRPATPFPETAPPILRRTRLRKNQYGKWSQELALFIATHLAGDYAIALQRKVRQGDKDTIRLLSQIFNLVKNESGVKVNLQNNIGIQNSGNSRQIDGLVRMLDERDRTTVIDEPVAGEDLEIEESTEED